MIDRRRGYNYLTVAAARSGMSPRALRGAIKRGAVPGVQSDVDLRRPYLVQPADLARYQPRTYHTPIRSWRHLSVRHLGLLLSLLRHGNRNIKLIAEENGITYFCAKKRLYVLADRVGIPQGGHRLTPLAVWFWRQLAAEPEPLPPPRLRMMTIRFTGRGEPLPYPREDADAG